MATFIVRVQLSTESDVKYTLLRDNLLKIGFTKRIRSKNGIEYRLPNGNYLIESNKSKETILNAVVQIATIIDKSSLVLVTESKDKGSCWHGLSSC